MATTPITPTPETVTPVSTTPPVSSEPVVPDGFNKYEKRSDGSYYAQLGDGTEFTGSNEFELVSKIGKAKVDTAEWGKQGWAKVPEPVVTQPTLTEEQRQAVELRRYLSDQVAQDLGMSNGEELKRVTQNLVKNNENYQRQQEGLEFFRRCPDFPNSSQNSEKLTEIMKNQVGWDPETVPTANQLQLAHFYAVQTGVYKPMTQDEINASRGVQAQTYTPPNAAPMLNGTQPEMTTQPNNNWTMDLKQLEAQVNAGIRTAGGLMNALKPTA